MLCPTNFSLAGTLLLIDCCNYGI